MKKALVVIFATIVAPFIGLWIGIISIPEIWDEIVKGGWK